MLPSFLENSKSLMKLLLMLLTNIHVLEKVLTLKQSGLKIFERLPKKTGEISVFNDGDGIPVEKYKGEDIYIPELIFGNLLTSSNYTEGEKKHVGGKNGYGAKLVTFSLSGSL